MGMAQGAVGEAGKEETVPTALERAGNDLGKADRAGVPAAHKPSSVRPRQISMASMPA